MTTRPIHMALSEQDFRTLVAGGIVETQFIRIILSDIGWTRMQKAIDDANAMTESTERERAVLRAIDLTRPPYADEVQRKAGLPPDEFKAAVSALRRRGIVARFTAPKGELLYDRLSDSPG
jgi:hypothetical protein